MIRKLLRVAAWAAAIVLVAAGALAIYVWSIPTGPEPSTPVSGTPADMAKGMSRGEYLAKAADCAACHTAADSGLPYAGGRAFKLPFGTLYSTNISPDKEFGIGAMSDDAFVDAVRKGIGSHGRLYPAMPYTSYSRLSRADVLDIKHYLLGQRSVHQAAPANALFFPFNQRWGMNLWNLGFFRERRFEADPSHNQQWNRGAYLAGPLGHCAECHTPRNLAFALKDGHAFAGEITDGWKAYNITSDKQDGIGAWSDDQLAAFLTTGHAPGRSSAAGPMAEVVQNSTQFLSPADTKALIAYLRTVQARTGGQSGGTIDEAPGGAGRSNAVLPDRATAQSQERGYRLFAGDCAGCHQWDGKGRQTDHASLLGSRAVNDATGTAVVQILLHGTDLKVGRRDQLMPAFGAIYSDADIAATANFVLAHFGAKEGRVSAEQVRKQRSQ